jgi:predicted amidohydrolase YtcJ
MHRVVILICVALAIAGAVLWFVMRPAHATLMLINGTIYTVDGRNTVVQAVAVEGDRLIATGSNAAILRGFRADTVIDLQHRAVYPGFVDAHAHLEGLGIALMTLNLAGTSSVDEIRSLVAEEIARTGGGSWVRGRGWDQNRWTEPGFPTHRMLDLVSETVPIFLVRIDGHAAWVNGKVLSLAGITRATPDPPGGRILRDHEGNPTGVFVDAAIDTIRALMPSATVPERTRAVRLAVEKCLSVGLSGVHDMGADSGLVSIYKRLISSDAFPFRVYAAIDGAGPTWNYYRARGPEIDFGGGRLTVRALKLYADGALGSRGAALIEPYTDDPGNRGLTLASSAELRHMVDEALEAGFQVCTHAIGDRANTIVLNVYEQALKEHGLVRGDRRLRIEHAQVIDRADIPRFSRLGVIPSMQPTHCTSDMPWATARLGPIRVRSAYAWRALLDAGNIIPAGSDFPVEAPNPLFGFYAAITRQDQEGMPEGGWYPEQRMTREEALKAFTLWPARAAFQEAVAGSLEPGKRADLVVLGKDIMSAEPSRIPGTPVEMTIVGGRIVFVRDNSPGPIP